MSRLPTAPDTPTPDLPPQPEPDIDTTRKQQPDDPDQAAKLPHERDQSVNMTDHIPSPEMQQAHADLQKGLVDTDARGSDGKPLGSQRRTP